MIDGISKERIMTNEDIVLEYFKLMSNKNVDGLLNLFANDAILYEPFSSAGGLHGKSAIEPFLRVATMANEGLRRDIVIEKKRNKGNKITALVTFERGDQAKGRFTFEFDKDSKSKEGKIKSLHIQFI